MSIQIANKRYYLHKMARKKLTGIRIQSRKKLVFIGYTKYEEAKKSKYVSSLITLGYSLQLEIE